MNPRSSILLTIAALAGASACQGSGAISAPSIDAPFSPQYATWVAIMENVMDPNYFDVMRAEAKKGAGSMNLEAIANAAEESADYVALGYGIHRDQEVEEFAEFARSAEAWLREVADRARHGQQIGLEQLIFDGEARYCDRCHDAAR